mmetsp:Transcript_99738/g.197822  ORF Transcript_99738/g.197822 Transcript_99738/m.197822 type:complete len:275 (+) Transcript_99738:44-868(+)
MVTAHSRHTGQRRFCLVCAVLLLWTSVDSPSITAFVTPKASLLLCRPPRIGAQSIASRKGIALRAVGETATVDVDEATDDTATVDVGKAFSPKRSRLVQAWGTVGVISYLSFGVAKVVPIVLEGLGAIDSAWQWGLLAITLIFFAYVEGYKGFQNGFSPRVVSRAWIVSEETADAPLWHKVLAPAFCIGYFHGTFKRVATSWGVTTVIFAVVIGVKQLANPYRAIIDAGVIVGLIWGIVSIIVLFASSLQNDRPPDFDPALPEETPYTAPKICD